MKSKVEQQKFQSFEEKTENGQQQVQELDEETERLIFRYGQACARVGSSALAAPESLYAQTLAREDALRSRIRELCQQAREEGRVSTLSLHRENLRGGAFFAEVDRLRDEALISDNPDKESR